jgi:hypothetical protein
MTDAVLADAQFGIARVLRPFAGFEDVYQGQPGNVPIAIPGDLDVDAGKEGFNPNLIRGQAVPFGSKITLWIPTILSTIQGQPIPYAYQVIWRLRNLRDFRANRSAYHFPRQEIAEDNEFVIPSAKKVILFEGPNALQEDSNTARQSQTSASFEALQMNTNLETPPLTPSGSNAAIQQGLGADAAPQETSSYNAIQMDAEGDEMIILVTIRTSTTRDWDFGIGGDDNNFSRFYGSGSGKTFRDLGIYVFTGSNP